MSQVGRRAVLSLVFWGIAGTGFVTSFLAGGGPASYDCEPVRILIGAGFLLLGFAGFHVGLWVTRSRRDAPVVADERDEWIALRASRAALVVVLVAALLFAVTLWTGYREAGCVPVGWMWFMGYTIAIVGYLSQAIATLVLQPRPDDGAHNGAHT